MKSRMLTKSRFKLALECPTKLYYTGKRAYANQKIEDSFLLALADGGFQVGELAKHYFPGGHEIASLDQEEALEQTRKWLAQENVILYEAAIQHENLFIRVDILKKQGTNLELIEVKAKSYDPESTSFYNAKGDLASAWEPYLMDVAFQKYVTQLAFPQSRIQSYLMMADKSALCPTDGLNQKFRIVTRNGRRQVTLTQPLTPQDLSTALLRQVKVDEICHLIWEGAYELSGTAQTFASLVGALADQYQKDHKIPPRLTLACGQCEFQTTAQDKAEGLISGREECWTECLGWGKEDFAEATLFDVWNLRKKDVLLGQGILKMDQLQEEDIQPKEDGKPGISPSQRQWLQIHKSQTRDNSPWIDRENLRREMDRLTYPLHFIDFETAAVAIPFNRGRRPYEGIAFQFSHHIMDKDGQVAHVGQYLNVEQGIFPNFDFLRELKRQLEQDQGSIFRYAAHENTYLNLLIQQLLQSPEPVEDAKELVDFARSITQSVGRGKEAWVGPRNMVDQCEWVKRYYFDPAMGGSNSIKKVLPAILNGSTYLQSKYSTPCYGQVGGIQSHNYRDWTWVRWKDGKVADPYSLLPKLFQDISDEDQTLLSENDEIKEGGAALTAYARMQFEEMSPYERQEIRQGLLKYCELDTFAMVLIHEGWRAMVEETEC